MKRYEGLFILNTAGREEGVKDALDKISAEITSAGGKVETVQKMDKRNFSRVADKKFNAGYYVNVIFEGQPSLIDQLKHVYINATLDLVETPQYFPKILRKDFAVALNLQTSGPDPDPLLKWFYGCGSSLNWDGYCSPEVDKLIDEQSREADPGRRKTLVWQIERKLAQDSARPIIFYPRTGTCRQPYVKGWTAMANSLFNGWRMEDVWLDK